MPDTEGLKQEVILGLGSNMGDRLSYLDYSVNKLKQSGIEVTALSSVWETEPWGFESEELFLNMVLIIRTSMEPRMLLEVISSIESSMGRRRRKSQEYQSRVIDIDILLWGERIIAIPGLQVPHTRLAQRRFVLEPLCEVAPGAVHPVSRKTMKELLALCEDNTGVKLFKRQTK